MKIVFLDANTLGGQDLSAFCNLGEVIIYEKTKQKDVVKNIADAEIIVINKIKMTKEIMQECKNLKLIQISATGTNNIDLEAAKDLNIKVKNVAGYSTSSVTQHTFALLLSLMNETLYYNEFSKNAKWCELEIFCDYSRRINTINDKTWGIIGLGAIGKSVAKVAKLFGANVIYSSLSGKNNDDEFKKVNLDELLKTSDIISIHSPLNDKSYHLIGEKELDLLKDKAYLLNLGRGGIIDENALAKALDNKNIRVGLDVIECEPMDKNNPLLSIKKKENLIITPHIAWAACECIDILCDMMFKNIKEFIDENK